MKPALSFPMPRFAPAAALALALALALIGVAGCSLRKAAPIKHTYLIEARRSSAPAARQTGASLRIRGWQVAPAFDGRNFVYRLGPLKYDSDFYNEFVAPPRLLFSDQARRWLAASGAFAAVTDTSSQADATLGIEGTVTELYGDYRDPVAPKAVLAVQIVAFNPRADNARALLQREYRRELALTNAAPATLAEGWSRALTEVLQEVEGDLVKLVRR